MQKPNLEFSLRWGEYDTSQLLRRYLEEFHLQAKANSNPEVSTETEPRFINCTAICKRTHKIIAGANLQFFYDYLVIDQIWVEPSHRNKGIGISLFSEIENHGKKRRLRRILLSSYEFQNVIPFWLKLGFVEVGRIKEYPPGQQLVYMHKSI